LPKHNTIGATPSANHMNSRFATRAIMIENLSYRVYA
jgi:hypothetical protein